MVSDRKNKHCYPKKMMIYDVPESLLNDLQLQFFVHSHASALVD